MPNIKPVSDLRNYNSVLKDVAKGKPVFLTKNGRGKYAILDMEDYEKAQISLLLEALKEGEESGEKEGWIKSEDVWKYLGIKKD